MQKQQKCGRKEKKKEREREREEEEEEEMEMQARRPRLRKTRPKHNPGSRVTQVANPYFCF